MLDRALSSAREPEVIAYDDMSGIETVDENLANEDIGSNIPHRRIETRAIKNIDAVISECLVFFPEPHEPGQWFGRCEELLRGRFEAHDDCRPAFGPCFLDDPIQQLRVTEVQAVIGADRHDTAPCQLTVRQVDLVPDKPHVK